MKVFVPPRRFFLASLSMLMLAACQEASEPAPQEAAETAADLEAAAENTADPEQAEVLRNQAEALEEVAKGDPEDVEGEVKVTGQTRSQ